MHEKIELSKILKLSKNKQIIIIECEFGLIFKKIINIKLNDYKGLPLEMEDFYYEFLYYIPLYLKEFSPKMNVPLRTYLGLKCKYFVSNKCRKYSSNKHKVLNNYISFNGLEETNRLEDSTQMGIPIDISKLSKIEVLIYNDYFLDGMIISKIFKKHNISRYKIKKIINNIKVKLLIQIKN